MKPFEIAVLAGDGVGPEVTAEAVRALRTIGEAYGHDFVFRELPVGGAGILESGSPLPQRTLEGCLASDAVLLGAVGGPAWDKLEPAKRPEGGLLALRQALGGFANLRPAVAYEALLGNSPLRRETIEGADVLFVRELLGGLYFAEPRGWSSDGSSAFNTLRYSAGEIERVAHLAFQLAQGRRRKVASIDKANVLEVSQLWRRVVSSVAAAYPEVSLEHLYVDACAMHLVANPRRFDVLLAENLFGDILSDEAAAITGSIGMLPSATLGGSVNLYEPVHGSAPDIAGQDVANPLGAIASAALLLRHSLHLEEEATELERAIGRVLDRGHRTADIARQGEKTIGTRRMGGLVSEALTTRKGTAATRPA